MSSNLSHRLTQVAIVEDHPEFREALSQVVSACPGMQLLEVCKDLPAGLSLLQRTCPDVLLVDLGLPSGSGLQLIRLARRQWGPRCTSAVLTVTGNEEHLVGAVAAGAKGYLFKSDQPEDWCRALMDLSAGRSPLHATMALSFSKLAAEASQAAPTGKAAASGASGVGFDTTTQALLQHIAAGYTPQEAAHKLNLDPSEAGERIRSVYDSFAQGVPELSPRELELLQLLNKGYTFKQCAELTPCVRWSVHVREPGGSLRRKRSGRAGGVGVLGEVSGPEVPRFDSKAWRLAHPSPRPTPNSEPSRGCLRHLQEGPAPEHPHLQPGLEEPAGASSGGGRALPDLGRKPAPQVRQRPPGPSPVGAWGGLGQMPRSGPGQGAFLACTRCSGSMAQAALCPL